MKRRISFWVVLGVSAGALFLSGCATTETRINQHPEIYGSLSPRDQALVRQGQIREGMSESAVWLAWGSPEQKAAGSAHGRPMETWIYMDYSYPYPSYYPYHHYGFSSVSVIRRHHGRRYFVFGDPLFYDPFYSFIPPRIAYPYKTVSFARGRVVSYQVLVPGGGRGPNVSLGIGVSGGY